MAIPMLDRASLPGFFRQTRALVKKNFIHLVFRRYISTFVQVLVLPIVLTAVFVNLDNFIWPKDGYGFGPTFQTRSFAESLSRGGDMVFVSNSSLGPDVATVVKKLTEPLAHMQDRLVFLQNPRDVFRHCDVNFRGISNCHAALIFNDSPLTPTGSGNWSYTIRVDPARSTEQKVDVHSNNRAADMIYMPLQLAVDSAITNHTFNLETYQFTARTQEEQNKSTLESTMWNTMFMMGIVLFLPMVVPVYHVVSVITTERRQGLSALTDVMGGGPAARVYSHVITFNLLYLPTFIANGLLFWGYMFPYSNPTILIFWYIFTGVSLINSAVFAAAFFQGPRISSVFVAACVIAIAGGSISEANSTAASKDAAYGLSAIFPSANFIYLLIRMCYFTVGRWPIDMASFEYPPLDRWRKQKYEVAGYVFWIFLLMQMVLYPLAAILAERLVHGISFKGRTFDTTAEVEKTSVAVKTSGLRKVYPPSIIRRMFCCGRSGPTVTAIDGLDLVAQKRQILCLLGVNGSGKTTTLDIIAGIQASTAGNVRINARHTELGVCPQRNVLFPYLTVLEHLKFWSDLKHGGEDFTALANLIEYCDLTPKTHFRAAGLSGGQKRKLQLACMLVGGSTVCLMDEVTSGLDPLSRRAIWNIILGERSKRSMVFTTHFLDEGETLADHIVLVSKGKIVCQGSAAELKNRFGDGYVVHVPRTSDPTDLGVPMTIHQDRIQYHVADSKAAAALIARLEKAGRSGVAISGPTIEDVFLKLTKDVDETLRRELGDGDLKKGAAYADEQAMHKSESGSGSPSAAMPTTLVSGRPISSFRQILVLMRKRLTILPRYWVAPLLALGLPAGLPAALKSLLITSRDRYQRPGCDANETLAIIEYDYVQSVRLGSLWYNGVLPVGPPSINGTLSRVLREFPVSQYFNYNQSAPGIMFQDTVDSFNELIRRSASNVSSTGGLFVKDGTSALLAVPASWGGRDKAMALINVWTGMESGVKINARIASLQTRYNMLGSSGASSLTWIICAALILTVYPVFFSLYPAYEKSHNIRTLQYTNGVRPFPLWMSHLLFDFAIVLVASVAMTATIVSQLSDMFWSPGYIFIISCLYGLCAILIGYLIARVARSQLGAFLWTLVVLLIQYIGALLAFMLTQAYLDPVLIQGATDSISWAMGFFFPIVSVMKAFMVGLNTYKIACRNKEAVTYAGHIYAYGGPILLLIIQVILLILLLVWLESNHSFDAMRSFVKQTTTKGRKKRLTDKEYEGSEGRRSGGSGSDEIAKETARVEATTSDLLRMTHVTKSFGSKVAVEDVSFGLGEGEILALLGPNGAGKTTMANMIMGEMRPDSGNIYLRGIDVHHKTRLAQRSLGVCPQFDALDLMTARQHLEFYARIRGVPDVQRNVSVVLDKVGLTPHADKKGSKLSGGNKRRLSLGIALVGNPDVLVLDEPSSSMDAAAKRVMWKTLAEIGPGRSLLLTTHSMEEADALATRAAIVSKRLLAIGTTQQLRDRYSDLYQVQLVLRSAPESSRDEMARLEAWVSERFPGVEFEGHSLGGQVKFTVPNKDAGPATSLSSPPLPAGVVGDDADEITAAGAVTATRNKSQSTVGRMISVLEEHKEELGLQDYSVGAPTLEKVFLSVVKNNFVEEERQKKAWWKFG